MTIARKGGSLGLLLVALVAFAAGRWAGPEQVALGAQEQGNAGADATLQAATSPDEHHRAVDVMIGDWEGTVKVWLQPGAPPMEAPGRIEREWILDGRYIREEVTIDAPGGAFKGLGFFGYNALDGRYESVWLENQSTAISYETGYLDREAMILRTQGQHRDAFTGQIIATRNEIDLSVPDRQTFTGFAIDSNGRENRTLEGTFTRAGSSPGG